MNPGVISVTFHFFAIGFPPVLARPIDEGPNRRARPSCIPVSKLEVWTKKNKYSLEVVLDSETPW